MLSDEHALASAVADSEESVSVREVLAILFLRKWAIAAVFVAVVAVAAFMTMWFITPLYEASGTLVISNNNLSMPLIESMPITDFEKLASFHTQKDIIRSTTLAAQVVDKMDLGQRRVLSNVERLRLWAKDQRRAVGRLLGIERWKKPEDMRASAIAALIEKTEIVTKPESQAMKIVYRARDPNEAAETLNLLIAEYQEYYHARIRERAEGVVDYIESQMGEVRSGLRASETAMLRFKESDRLVMSPTATGTSSSSRTERPKPDAAPPGSVLGPKVRAGTATTTNDATGAAVQVDRPTARATSLVGLTDSAIVQNELKAYVLAMEEELRKLRAEYSDNHPAVSELRRKIATYVAALNHVPEKELEMLRLKRELDVNQEAFMLLKKNLEKAKLVAGGQADMVHLIQIVERPQANDDPVSPKPRLTMILAVVFGLLFGIVWAIILDWLDHTISGAKDIQRFLGTRMLGSLPRL